MPFEIAEDELIEILLKSSREEIALLLEDVHPEDLLDVIRQYGGDKSEILKKLPEEMLVNLVDQAEDEEKVELLNLLPEENKELVINEMSSDELVDLLGSVTPDEALDILDKIDDEEALEVKELLSYESDSAGGIMATEFISVKEAMTIGETLSYLQKEAPDAETAYYIYVVDEEEHLKGVVSLRDIVINRFDVKVSEIMHENIIRVPVTMDQEEAGHLFEKYGFMTMPVVDENDVMLGIITVDDIMEVLRDENTEDIYRLAGLQEGEIVTGSVSESVKKRLPWLFVNLCTALLAAYTVSLFEGTINKVVTLAAFMPIVAGMGGNTGTQTLTLIVRGIALGELTYENSVRVLIKEIMVGISMGVSVGIAASLLGYFWEGNAVFGLVIGCAMLLNMTVATFAGFMVPMALKKLNIDPALASSVFVTTATDVLGFFFFLGLATACISYLI
ncbi:magnesium transporter MgtE [Oxobacter pfennigii]|uniref:Magnesium transporter MgtE n=1 Tax=Oxobacter pfennigii TaxID=36849 RepID=A0A0P8W2T2_9CLOT|nr:magnesium transporter [Oxobacter pfennigii]KPU42845.1 magnesium transporter MgtE [Oxobacter pfennigii]